MICRDMNLHEHSAYRTPVELEKNVEWHHGMQAESRCQTTRKATSIASLLVGVTRDDTIPARRHHSGTRSVTSR
jgi:hypothetical protein